MIVFESPAMGTGYPHHVIDGGTGPFHLNSKKKQAMIAYRLKIQSILVLPVAAEIDLSAFE